MHAHQLNRKPTTATPTRIQLSASDAGFILDTKPYSLYALCSGSLSVAKPIRKGAEEARNQLPELLTAAQQGRQTIITRHGRAVAVLAPVSASGESRTQRSLLPLAGSGRGLYGRDSQATLRRLREEWSR